MYLYVLQGGMQRDAEGGLGSLEEAEEEAIWRNAILSDKKHAKEAFPENAEIC